MGCHNIDANLKICIITVYFGKLPNYISLWIKSVRLNSNIDFFLYTDDSIDTIELPDNLHVIKLTLPQMKNLADKALNMSVCLDRPYKCCDFKPVYGLIFKDDICSYDYWGHCDLDMIFGDLSRFFNQYEINKYDRFLTLGHLSLFRNNDEVNNRYKANGSFRDFNTVFTNSNSYAFDEFNGITSIYLANRYSMFTKRIFADISPNHKRFTLSTLYSLDRTPRNYRIQTFIWDNGKVFHIYYIGRTLYSEEYAYIHFQKRGELAIQFCGGDCDSFYVTNNGFIKITDQIEKAEVKRINKYPGFIFELYETMRFKLNQWIILNGLRIKKLKNRIGKIN